MQLKIKGTVDQQPDGSSSAECRKAKGPVVVGRQGGWPREAGGGQKLGMKSEASKMRRPKKRQKRRRSRRQNVRKEVNRKRQRATKTTQQRLRGVEGSNDPKKRPTAQRECDIRQGNMGRRRSKSASNSQEAAAGVHDAKTCGAGRRRGQGGPWEERRCGGLRARPKSSGKSRAQN